MDLPPGRFQSNVRYVPLESSMNERQSVSKGQTSHDVMWLTPFSQGPRLGTHNSLWLRSCQNHPQSTFQVKPLPRFPRSKALETLTVARIIDLHLPRLTDCRQSFLCPCNSQRYLLFPVIHFSLFLPFLSQAQVESLTDGSGGNNCLFSNMLLETHSCSFSSSCLVLSWPLPYL